MVFPFEKPYRKGVLQVFELNVMAWKVKPLVEELKALGSDEEKKVFRKEVLNNSYEYNYIMNYFLGGNSIVDDITRDLPYSIKDDTQFFDQAWKHIEHCIARYNGTNSFYSFVVSDLKRLLKKIIKEAAYTEEIHIEDLAEDEAPVYEFDELIVDEVSIGDFIEDIAGKFRQKDKAKFVLTKFVDGFKASDIARLMVNVYGGKVTSHEQYISRLKNKCLELLKNITIITTPEPKRRDRKFFDAKKWEENRARWNLIARQEKGSPVKIEKWSKEEVEEYLLETYGANHKTKKKKGVYDPKWEKCKENTRIEFGNRCFCCGKEGTAHHTHHAWGRKRYPKLRYVQSNLFLLCKDCHSPFSKKGYALHSQAGLKPNEDITGHKFLEWYKWMYYLQQNGVVDFKYITPDMIAYAERKINDAEKILNECCPDNTNLPAY